LATTPVIDTLFRLSAIRRRGSLGPSMAPTAPGKRAMQEATTKGIYDFHSVFYDATFGRLVKRRIARAISHMNIASTDKVLDLGIGTGVSLNYHAHRGHIVGIDLSNGMLRE